MACRSASRRAVAPVKNLHVANAVVAEPPGTSLAGRFAILENFR
jgi:hypothetical protein